MQPIKFKDANTTFPRVKGSNSVLPALCFEQHNESDPVISCWRGSLRERLAFLLTGRLWVTQFSMGEPLQPLAMGTHCPFKVTHNPPAKEATK